jgi:hypothetical protein
LVTCRSVAVKVRRHGRTHTVKRQRCRTRAAGHKVSFVTKGGAHASLRRHGRTVAKGSARAATLVLSSRRRLHHGRYTLVLRAHGRTTRQAVRVGSAR